MGASKLGQEIIFDLLKNEDLYIKNNGTGKRSYKVYGPNVVPLYYVKDREFRKIKGLLKMDKKNRYTVNRSIVRQLHGNAAINKEYKKLSQQNKNEKANNQHGHTEAGAKETQPGCQPESCSPCAYKPLL